MAPDELATPQPQLTADQINRAEHVLGLLPWQTDLLRRLNGIETAPACRHVYVSSDGTCLHCNRDCLAEIAAAADALNARLPLLPQFPRY